MMKPPTPENEGGRLEALRRYSALDTPPEEAFDRITRLAAAHLDVPTVLISLVDETRQWFKARHGLDVDKTPRDIAFCAHTIMGDVPMIVPDTLLDARFRDNPLVTGAPHVRFCAGVPLRSHDGHNLGALCAMDSAPKTLTAEQTRVLVDLANLVVDGLELRLVGEEARQEAAGREAIEDELRKSEERMRDIINASSDWLWEMGPDLRFTFFSKSFRDITCIDPQALIGKSHPELVAEGEDSGKRERLHIDLEKRRPFRNYRYEIKRSDGTTLHLGISGKPVFGDKGEFKGYRGTGSNLTAQVEAERRAASAQMLLMDAVESMPDMMALYDAEDRFVISNKIYRETLRDIEDMLVPGN